MAATTTIALFSELSKQLNRENFTKCVDLCNKICTQAPNDPDALKIKCVSLIRLGKFPKALEIASKTASLAFEHAYCLYRLKKEQEALSVLDKIPNPKTEAMLHLKAQILYRINEFDECIDIYKNLKENNTVEEAGAEIQTNLLGAYASAGRGSEVANDMDDDVCDTYEAAYNRGCACIQNGDLETAKSWLTRAEDLCQETLKEEGFTEEEIEKERAVIQVQLGYLEQQNGQDEAAQRIYQAILQKKPCDPTLSAVASNNIVVLRKDKDVFDSFKRLKNVSLNAVDDRLTALQKQIILANRARLLCMMNKGTECREEIKKLEEKKCFPATGQKIMVSLLLREKNYDGCVKYLQTLPQTPETQLMQAHVKLIQGQPQQAAKILESIESIRNLPGTVATIVALYAKAGKPENAIEVLGNAINSNRDGDESVRIREGDGLFKMSTGMYREAADAFQALVDGSGSMLDSESRIRITALLIIALSHIDPEAAERQSTILPLNAEEIIDAADYEKTAPRISKTRVSRMMAKIADADAKKRERKRQAQNPEKIARKRQRRREKYLDTLMSKDDYNPSIGLVKPDPERWIPRKQRSYAKRGRRGRNKFVGAQGSGMGGQKDALKLDAAARAALQEDHPPEKKGVVVDSKPSAAQRKARKKKRR